MPADLHIHSTYSDGTETPQEIVEHAKGIGLKAISITDHDTIDGIEEAEKAGMEFGVEVIPGIELSTLFDQTEMHILGYFVDHNNQELKDMLKDKQEARKKRIKNIIEKLRNLKIDIDAQEVFEVAKNESPGRPHVAKVLINKGIVQDLREAFARFLGSRCPAYVPHPKLLPKDAVSMIKKSGGIAVMAHLGIMGSEKLIPDLIAAGLKGLEVYYPSHSKETTDQLFGLSKKYNLLITGGSDYHGKNSGRDVKLGDIKIDDSLVEELKREHSRGN